MILSDHEREKVIAQMAELSCSGPVNIRRHWFDLMKQEIARRSDEQVRRMEIAKGLRAVEKPNTRGFSLATVFGST